MQNVLVDIFKKHGPAGALLCFDVDLTLRNSMCRETPVHETAALMELYFRSNEGLILMTGRSSEAVDETFCGQFPGSFEHHSAIRLEQGGDIIALAPELNTSYVAQRASQLINGHIYQVEDPEKVRDAEGRYACVYPEVKSFAIALVHSLGHDEVDAVRNKLQEVASHILTELKIDNTHKIAIGNDAIEIVPRGLGPNSAAAQFLEAGQIDFMKQNGLSKIAGVHNFMSLSQNQNRTPYVIGDSGTDGVAMNAAHQSFNGGGIWVSNGKPVPEQFSAAVDNRMIQNFSVTWDHINNAVEYLREHRRKVVLMPTLST